MVYKARLHPDAIRPVGGHIYIGTPGAHNVQVPDGASGIMMQRHTDRDDLPTSQVYFDEHEVNTPMTGDDEGFSLPYGGAIVMFWFDPAVTKWFNFWIQTNGDLFYHFISPARPV